MTDSFAIRNSSFGLRHVRHSNFVIRHCPDPHDATGRFPFGLPRTDNVTATRASAKPKLAKPDRRSVGETELHYLWIQLFHSALNEKGRAGFVMANSASDARSSEQELRRQLIETALANAIANN